MVVSCCILCCRSWKPPNKNRFSSTWNRLKYRVKRQPLNGWWSSNDQYSLKYVKLKFQTFNFSFNRAYIHRPTYIQCWLPVSERRLTLGIVLYRNTMSLVSHCGILLVCQYWHFSFCGMLLFLFPLLPITQNILLWIRRNSHSDKRTEEQ